MRGPDYNRIAELERDIYGQALTATPRAVEPWRGDRAELDEAVRRTARFLLSWGPLPPDLAGSRVAAGCRVAVQLLLAVAVIVSCLAFAGIVPWDG